MRARRLFHSFAGCLATPALFVFIMIRNLPDVRHDNRMEYYFISNFMGVSAKTPDIVQLLIQIIPEIVILYLFSGTFLADYEINYIYVFTRIGKKQKWLRQKTCELFCQVCLSFMLIFLVSFLLGMAAGFIPSANGAPIYTRLFLFQAAPMFLMLFVQNFASLSLGRSRSFLLLLNFYVVSITLSVLFYNFSPEVNLVLSLLPPSSQMYFWHVDSPHGVVIDAPLNCFTTTFSAVWLAACFGIAYLAASGILQKKDLIEIMKGESS